MFQMNKKKRLKSNHKDKEKIMQEKQKNEKEGTKSAKEQKTKKKRHSIQSSQRSFDILLDCVCVFVCAAVCLIPSSNATQGG